jgi:hypothetical protein
MEKVVVDFAEDRDLRRLNCSICWSSNYLAVVTSTRCEKIGNQRQHVMFPQWTAQCLELAEVLPVPFGTEPHVLWILSLFKDLWVRAIPGRQPQFCLSRRVGYHADGPPRHVGGVWHPRRHCMESYYSTPAVCGGSGGK